MKITEERIARAMNALGWILVWVGGLFSIGVFLSSLQDLTKPEPLWMLFFIGLIFCSIASGMFFVVLAILIRTLKNIESNTKWQRSLYREWRRRQRIT